MLGTVPSIGMTGIPSTTTLLYAGESYDITKTTTQTGKNSKILIHMWMQIKDIKKCFTEAHDRGDNLAGYEVEDCDDDSDSYGDEGDDGYDKN